MPPRLVYLDTNVLIYWIERPGPIADSVQSLLLELTANGARLVTSELTLAECLYKPARDGNRLLSDLYERALVDGGDIALLRLDGPVVVRAAKAGGALGLKLLDAIHFVSAMEAGAQIFLTADHAFQSTDDLQVIHVN